MKTFLEKVQNSFWMNGDYGKKYTFEHNLPDKVEPILLSEMLNRCECINIQNVCDYVTPLISEGTKYGVSDFPMLAPPFEVFWMEYRYIDNDLNGSLFYSTKDDDGDWWVSCVSFREMEYNGKIIIVPCPVTVLITVKNNGEPHQIYYKEAEHVDDHKDVLDDLLGNMWVQTLVPCLLAISFMHCKNVAITDHVPTKTPGKRVKRPSKVTFKTLEIKPMKAVLSSEGRIESNGLKLALHICRGHFKTFDGKGLFGKYTGTYWWDSQVRGKRENGIVIKDYRIDAPHQDNSQGA